MDDITTKTTTAEETKMEPNLDSLCAELDAVNINKSEETDKPKDFEFTQSTPLNVLPQEALEKISSTMNGLSIPEIRNLLEQANLSKYGDKKDVKKRYKALLTRRLQKQYNVISPAELKKQQQKKHQQQQKNQQQQKSKAHGKPPHFSDNIHKHYNYAQRHGKNYDYYLIVDFEATCEEDVMDYRHEIIEFPVVLLNSTTLKVEAEFQTYIRPKINPKLSTFCTKLTGITQHKVDNGVSFETSLKLLHSWMEDHNLFTDYTYAFVTDGPWDLGKFLALEFHRRNMKVPKMYQEYVDIRWCFCKHFGKRLGVVDMLSELGLEFEGRQHCGLDDSRNIARIVAGVLTEGIILEKFSSINKFKFYTEHILKSKNTEI